VSERPPTVPVAVRDSFRKSHILEACITGVLGSLILLGFLVVWERLGGLEGGETFSVEVLSSRLVNTPNVGNAAAAAQRCRPPKADLQLRLVGHLESTDAGQAVSSGCSYIVYWEGEGLECLVEYPLNTARGVDARGFAARLTRSYYALTHGGLPQVSADETTTTFLMIDSRWCAWFDADRGLFLTQ